MAELVLENACIALRDGDRSFELRLDGVRLEQGEIVALTGASGSGKTLMLEVLGLLRAPGSGMIYRFGETDLARLWQGGARSQDLAMTRGRMFGFVPQTGGLMPFLSVADNVALPQKISGRVDPGHVDSLLDRLGILDVARLYPAALSIGQRQRTAIARALAHQPSFVIADEPTAALDPESADAVLQLLLDIAGDHKTGIILSSHDLGRLDRFSLNRWSLAVNATGDIVQSTLHMQPC